MISFLLVALARAHTSIDSDDDGWSDKAEVSCGDYFVTDPTSFPGAREVCDGVDNDCDCKQDDEGNRVPTDECVDEDGACVDDVLPCYQVETANQPAVDGDPCLLATNPNPTGCAGGGDAFVLIGLLAFRRRRSSLTLQEPRSRPTRW